MIHQADELGGGFDDRADAVVVGSGAGGAVAAYNLAQAGLRTILLEAGPPVGPAQFNHHAPDFMADYIWDGGLRLVGGSAPQPMMQGRMIGGSTVVNSAIMFKLPDWVRTAWQEEDGLPFLFTRAADNAFKRILKQLHVENTPKKSFARRNNLCSDILKYAGLKPRPLPRAVIKCEGSGDCLTGCSSGRKQSVDKTHVEPALQHGLIVYSSCNVDRVIMKGNRAVGVEGRVVPREGRKEVANFKVHAPLVIMAAGATHSPAILRASGIKHAGRDIQVHLTGALFAVMKDTVHPWVGASQGVGAFSEKFPGVKYESLWASNSVMSVKWGTFGGDNFQQIRDLRNSLLIAAVYRGKSSGFVRNTPWGPYVHVTVKKKDMHPVYKALHELCPAFMKAGAQYVYSGIRGTKSQMRSDEDFAAMLNPKLGFRDISSTLNHVFCSCPMSANRKRASVDFEGRVIGTEGLYIADASVFPSPSAVNPQVTVMALADLISRRIAGLKDGDYLEQVK